MSIRVGRSRHGGHWVWFESIEDARECGVLDSVPATDAEAECARKILAANAKGMAPSLKLGDQMRGLLALRENAA